MGRIKITQTVFPEMQTSEIYRHMRQENTGWPGSQSLEGYSLHESFCKITPVKCKYAICKTENNVSIRRPYLFNAPKAHIGNIMEQLVENIKSSLDEYLQNIHVKPGCIGVQ